MKFARFDARHLTTLPVRAGYTEWAKTYDAQQDGIPIATGLLEKVPRSMWRRVRSVVDLGCGTGRIGVWMRRHGVKVMDGVDATPAMLARARRTRAYRRLRRGDLYTGSGLARGYDLALNSLVACHLPNLGRLYRRMRDLTGPAGRAIVVDFHPHFLLNGIPTHFPTRDGRNLAIVNHVHLVSDHVKAALRVGWRLVALDEMKVPAWVVKENAAWKKYVGRPISFLLHLEKPA